MNLENVKQEDWILGGLGLLLAIVLLFLPWFSASLGPFSASASATGAPDGWLGVLGVLASLAVLADLAVERLAPQTQVPAIGGSRGMTRFVLAVAAAVFVALKFLFHIHFSGIVSFDWGFYVAVVVAAALVYFAMQARQTQSTMPTSPAPPPPASPPPPPPTSAGPAGTSGPPPA